MSQLNDDKYLSLLNEQQAEAVKYCDGPSLVIAGAGSGKTRVLTYKIVHLLHLGIQPENILALTFTNKAAREMKQRIADLVGSDVAAKLKMGTFHSIFLRILRRHADAIGFKPGFTIYDTADSKSLIKTIVKDYGLDEKIYKPNTLAAIFSNLKNDLVTPDIYLKDPANLRADTKANRPMTGEIYSLYAERCRLAGAMDFDDILLYTNILLRDRVDIRLYYQRYFQYILVDEYQDTNFAQHRAISQLANKEQRVCVVGDDAQSIYSFRGANIDNILTLKNRFPALKIFKLERNYRSTQNIVNAASSLIAHNNRQMEKTVYSENAKGAPVEIINAYSDYEEAYLIANLISRSKLTHHDSLDDYAVLYRTNAQSRIVEEALRARNIAYRIYGGLSFYQRQEVKNAVCYFRVAVNPDDDEALRRIINFPARGIGDVTQRKLATAANERHLSLWQVILQLQSRPVDISKATVNKLGQFAAIILELNEAVAQGKDAFEVARLVFERTRMMELYSHDNTPENISRQENLTELLKGLREFVDMRTEAGEDDVSMASFLSEISLATDQDVDAEGDGQHVTLMTAHAAKGLEFKHVYIAGVEEDYFPSSMSADSLSGIEEERRLLYVAVTRAKETCTMTYANSRFKNGQTASCRPSRFLYDFDRQFVHIQASNLQDERSGKPIFFRPSQETRSPFGSIEKKPSAPAKPMKALKKQTSEAAARTLAESGLAVGMRISHERFGNGVVKELTERPDAMMIVDFEQFGEKKLLLRFAKYTILQ